MEWDGGGRGGGGGKSRVEVTVTVTIGRTGWGSNQVATPCGQGREGLPLRGPLNSARTYRGTQIEFQLTEPLRQFNVINGRRWFSKAESRVERR
jgi:hypothetical protein